MKVNESPTTVFLTQWHAGRDEGLQSLLERHLTWLHQQVSRKLSHELRAKGATCDFVQDAVVRFLESAPKFTIASEEEFRALLLKIAMNSMRNRYKWFTARRRSMNLEKPIPPDTVLALDPPQGGVSTPSRAASRNEQEAWVRLGMEFLSDDDRKVLVLREWDNLQFHEIGAMLDITENTAWMRHRRALEKLGDIIWHLRSGKIGKLL